MLSTMLWPWAKIAASFGFSDIVVDATGAAAPHQEAEREGCTD